MGFGLAHEQVDVIRHDDVAEEIEAVTLPKLFERFFEDDAAMFVLQPALLVIAGEVDGVVMAVFLIAGETAGHGADFSATLGEALKR